MSATGILFGVFLIFLAGTGLIDRLAKFFTKPIVRGIQLGLGFILISKGIALIRKQALFIGDTRELLIFQALPVNLLVGIVAVALVLFLLSSRRFPAALVVVATGICIGIVFGAFHDIRWGLTDRHPSVSAASKRFFYGAFSSCHTADSPDHRQCRYRDDRYGRNPFRQG